MKSNSMDTQWAKAAARRLYQKVNFSGGPLQSYEISTLLTDTYEYLKIPYKPTSKDIKSYTDVLDADKDGQVTVADLENLAVQYLCGSGVVGNQCFDSSIKKQKYEPSLLTNNTFASSFGGSTNKPSSSYAFEQTSNSQISDRVAVGRSAVHRDRPYGPTTLSNLQLTAQIFLKYATSYNTITIDRVPNLLSQTYELLGQKTYSPSEQDIKVWMKLCDGDGDGHVQYEEYEYFIIRSLERSGIDVSL